MVEEKCFYLLDGTIISFTPTIRTYEHRISTDPILLVMTSIFHSWWNQKTLEVGIVKRNYDIQLMLRHTADETNSTYWYFKHSEFDKLIEFFESLGFEVKIKDARK